MSLPPVLHLAFGVCHLTLRSPPSCPRQRRHKEAPYVQRCDRGPTGAPGPGAAAAAALQVGDKRTPSPAALYILQSLKRPTDRGPLLLLLISGTDAVTLCTAHISTAACEQLGGAGLLRKDLWADIRCAIAICGHFDISHITTRCNLPTGL